MRTVISIVLILTATLSISQTPHGIHANIEVDPLFERITVKLKSEAETLGNCKVQIIDLKGNTVKTVALPEASSQIETNIIILDLLPGNYTCLIYKGKETIYKGEFFKDAIFAEPQPQPEIHEPQPERHRSPD